MEGKMVFLVGLGRLAEATPIFWHSPITPLDLHARVRVRWRVKIRNIHLLGCQNSVSKVCNWSNCHLKLKVHHHNQSPIVLVLSYSMVEEGRDIGQRGMEGSYTHIKTWQQKKMNAFENKLEVPSACRTFSPTKKKINIWSVHNYYNHHTMHCMKWN